MSSAVSYTKHVRLAVDTHISCIGHCYKPQLATPAVTMPISHMHPHWGMNELKYVSVTLYGYILQSFKYYEVLFFFPADLGTKLVSTYLVN